jgi:hypothetical protein
MLGRSEAKMVGFVGLFLTACGVSEDHYWNEQAEITCDKSEKCDGEAFDDAYENKSECEDELLAQYDDYRTSYQDCSFDGAAASECLSKKKKQDCDEYKLAEVDECKVVYTCTED